MVERINSINFLNSENISKILNIIIASASNKTLKLPHKNIRPYFHTIISGLIGTGKSTLLEEICEILKVIPIASLTKATILGTIDRETKTFITPAIWDYRNTILPIDEFYFDHRKDSDVLNTLLQLMEKPIFNKKIGYFGVPFKKKDKDLYCKVENSMIKVKTRFSLMATTMMRLSQLQSPLTLALVSRSIVIPFNPSIEELEEIAEGKKYYKYEKVNSEKDNTINKKEYDYIINYVKKQNVQKSSFLRTVGDLCRIFSILKEHDLEIYDLIINLKKHYW